MKLFFDSKPRSLLNALSISLLILLFGTQPGHAATFTTDTLIDCGDTTHDGDDIVVDGCILTVNCAHVFNSLNVINGGVVTHSAYTGDPADKLELTITLDVTIDATSSIDANGKGYGASSDPGAGEDANNYGSGGGYGGCGGASSGGAVGGTPYGSVPDPVDLGSGGGTDVGAGGDGGYGGGAVLLTVGGTLQVDGSLTAEGLAGGVGAFGHGGGGGSGGSLYLTVGSLTGSGVITAKGGDGGVATAGGGGGGRIAIYHDTSTFSGTTTACGGSGYEWGGAGTIFTKSSAQSWGDLLVDNCGNSGGLTTASAPDTFDDITVTNKGQLDLTETNLTAERLTASEGGVAYLTADTLTVTQLSVSNEGQVYLPAQVAANSVSVGAGSVLGPRTGGQVVDMTVSGDVTVESGGSISANGKGHEASSGPGAGGEATAYGGGGGYGGAGGMSSQQAAGGTTYGSVTAPTDLGSGGGTATYASVAGGAGGGALLLTVSGALWVDGSLTANGGGGEYNSYFGHAGGGGSGGSVYVTVGALTGNGIISANGGNGGSGNAGGGGGGRIAIYAFDIVGYAGAITVDGGSGYEDGQPGTIHLSASEPPHAISHSPKGLVANAADRVDVKFDEAINGATFTPDDVVLVDPAVLEIPITSTPVDLGNNRWRITFDAQVAQGEYHLYIGPHIEDLTGYELNQDGDETPGEDPDDIYDAAFTIVSVEALTLGVSTDGGFSTNGDARYYSLAVTAGQDIKIQLDDLDDAGISELYVGFGYIPSTTRFEHRGWTAPLADKFVRIAGTRDGTYYVLVYAVDVPDPSPSDYTITADYLPLAIIDVAPDRGWNAETSATIVTIHGSGFDQEAAVVLHRDGQTDIPGLDVTWVDPGTMYAGFDLFGAEPGLWDVVVTNPDPTTVSHTFTVLQGSRPKLDTNLLIPEALGTDTPATLYIEYVNNGTAPIPAPLVKLTGSPNALLTVDEARTGSELWTSVPPPWLSDTVQVIALGSDPDPEILEPGDSGVIPVYYRGQRPPYSGSLEFNLGVLHPDDATSIDWTALKDDMRPESMPADTWDAIWMNLKAQMGGAWATWAEYVTVVADNAAYLRDLGQNVIDVGPLLAFEIEQASGLSLLRYLAGSVDVYSPAPGMPLVFTRVYGQSIESRYELGPLGRGWRHNWDIYALELSGGTVFIHGPNGLDRFFTDDGTGG